MKKLIFILFFIVLCFLPTYAKTLKAGISYTVEDARIESFTGISTKIDMNAYSKYLVDENYAENNKAQKRGKTKFRNRTLTVFSSGVYAIKYRSIDKKYFYYDNQGKLKKIDISIGDSYPRKRIAFDANGYLDAVALDVSKNEQFVFDKDKKLVAHWIGNNCYNEKGELVMTRE